MIILFFVIYILWYFTNALKKVNIFFSERDEQGLRWILQLRNCGPRQIGKYCALAKSRAGTSSTEWNVEIEPKKLVIPLEPVIEVKWIFTMFSLCHVLKVFFRNIDFSILVGNRLVSLTLFSCSCFHCRYRFLPYNIYLTLY